MAKHSSSFRGEIYMEYRNQSTREGAVSIFRLEEIRYADGFWVRHWTALTGGNKLAQELNLVFNWLAGRCILHAGVLIEIGSTEFGSGYFLDSELNGFDWC
ncbi:hypothetical protein Tco_1554197 [Tanacetum coccineum]